MLKIEESERLAALLTARLMEREQLTTISNDAALYRQVYQNILREFMELEKAEHAKHEEP